MGLKSSLKLFLLFCSLNLILNQEAQKLGPNTPVEFHGKEEKQTINIGEEELNDYITINFTSSDASNINPVVIVSTDMDCETGRITMTDQKYGTIFIFLKKEQIGENKELFLCINHRDNMYDMATYDIYVTNDQEANLPVDQQTSFFVNKENINMQINFIDEGKFKLNYITFWVKGKDIKDNTKITNNKYDSQDIDGGKVFFSSWRPIKNTMDVYSSEGDYVTVGSTSINNKKTSQNLIINGNEITVALSENEICFPIDFETKFSSITGKLYTLKGNTYFKNEDSSERIEGTVIQDGIISDYNEIRTLNKISSGFYCVYAEDHILLTIQMISFQDNIIVTPPALPGDIRRYILKSGEIAIFSAMTPTKEAKKLNFNVKSLKGFSDLYGMKENYFPMVYYTLEKIKKGKHPLMANRFSSFIYNLDSTPKEGQEKTIFNYLSSNQPLAAVYCTEGSMSKFSKEGLFCEIEVSIFTNKDTINIIEEAPFSQYLEEGETNIYKIKIPNEMGFGSKISIDLTLFTGDAEINPVIYSSGVFNKYYLANKVFYSFNYDQNKVPFMHFTVNAKKNVFYMVNYLLIMSSSDYEDKISLESGINYITSKDVDGTNKEKSIYLKNFKYEESQPYMASFYSPNCQYTLAQKFDSDDIKIIPQNDNYVNVILPGNLEKYQFIYNIEKDDGFNYPNKFCMVYAAGLELDFIKNWNGRSISLSEGLPHIFTYSKDSKFSHYSYYILNKSNSVVINFNLLDKARFKIYLRIDREDLYDIDIYRNKQLNITASTLDGRCTKENEICKLDIICEALDTKEERKVEITVYQLDKNPVYLEKNRVKNDFINGNTEKHYYFDISKEEYGDITLNFKRGSGNIYGVIESRIKDSSIEGADWRGVYNFPNAYTPGALKYRSYGKKLLISEDDTKSCTYGCYVLITVKSNREIPSLVDDAQYPFRISLNPRIIPKDERKENPKVKIGLNEFIFGDIFWLNPDIRKYDYYQVILTHDSNEVHIDWQADSPYLLINAGDNLPKLNDLLNYPDWVFPPLGDFVYRLSRAEILDNAGLKQTDSLKGVVLTIGIFSNNTDSLESSPYAFKLFEPPLARENEKIASELIHIRTDQKVQCLPLLLQSQYPLCIFAVVFDETDLQNNLILYPRSQNGKPFEKYGRRVEAEMIETNDVDKILELTIDTYENKNKYKKTDDYIYEEEVTKKEAYFLIISTEDNNGIIDVLSSTYAYENGMTFIPNPSTAQLFALQDKFIYLLFPTHHDLLLNINSINGIGFFNWEEEGEIQQRDMYLKGRGDRLSFTTYKYENKLPKLNVTSRTIINPLGSKAGFVFYITYYPRTYMDQLKPNTLGEIHYRTVNMPLSFYAHIGYYQPWIVNLNFYDIIAKNKNALVYEYDLFNIWGTVISEQDAYKARYDISLAPKPIDDNKIEGKFDALYGVIFFSGDDVDRMMRNYTILDKVPYVFFSVENTDPSFEYDTIGLEADVHSINLEAGKDFTPEGVYITGKLSSVIQGKKIYKIKINKQNPYIRIEYSTNSIYVKFALTFDFSSETTDDFEDKFISEASGRKILTVRLSQKNLEKEYLYFVAFADKFVEDRYDERLDYFVFKYLTGNDLTSFLEIKDLADSKIKVKENEIEGQKILTIEFVPLKYKDVSYFIKAIYAEEYVRGENLNSIAMSESKGMNMLVNVPDAIGQDTLSYDLTIPKGKDVLYVKIMAIFGFVEEKVIYLYSPYDVSEGREAKSINLIKTDQIQNITLLSKFRFIRGIMGEETNANKKQKYQVIFEDKALLLEYVKIEVTISDIFETPNPSPIVCISNSDEDCMIHRDQLSKGGFNTTEIFVKKEQFLDRFFFTVECQYTEKCNYNIMIAKQHEVVFNHLGIFNYYVSEDNKQMTFKFKNNNENEKGILNVYATGGKDLGLVFENYNDDICLQHDFSYGAGITVNTSSLEYFIIRITANNGDYISLGLKYFPNKQENQVNLAQETGQITGLLRKTVLEEECYILPQDYYDSYITGRLYDSNAKIKFISSEGEEKNPEVHKTENGFFYVILNAQEYNSLCFSLSTKEEEYSAYSLQIESILNFNGGLFLPQNTPIIYPRIIPKGKAIMLNGLLPKIESENIVYNMIVKQGYPKMYIYECGNYPLCEFDFMDIDNNPKFKKISDMNGMSSFFTNEMRTPIDADQKLLVIKCNDVNSTGKYEYNNCEVLSTIFGEKEVVQLIEKQPFGRYNTPDITNHYLIDLSSVKEPWFKVHIDFLVVSGDVSINIQNNDPTGEIDAHKYYLSNKIFFSITVDRDEGQNGNLQKILIDTKSKINSYYIVEYKLITIQKEELYTNIVRTGINYLVPITTSKDEIGNLKKDINIESIKIVEPYIFISSFYSLNCNFEIEKINNDFTREKIKSYGRYAQDYYSYKVSDEVITKHSYTATVVNKLSLYNNDMCMLYVSGIELYNVSNIRKEILVSEGVPQRMIFEGPIERMRYVFPHADPQQNLTCSINMIVPGKFRIHIYFREQEYNIDKVYTQSGIFYIYNYWIQSYCEEVNERCSVTVELEKLENFNDESPIVEFSIKKVMNTPYYFPREIQKKDYITNDAYLFLYTDIGNGDDGYVTIDFNRGSGYVYGKLVKTDQTEVDENADWRNYKFIRYKDEKSLDYDYFNKKIKFTHDETAICVNGCFLLISVVSSIIKVEAPPFDFLSFNILVGFNPETNYFRRESKIEIIPDEFVIGSFYKNALATEFSVENYTIICPYDAEAVEIDWQTNIVKLNVKINDFEKDFTNNGNSLIAITKDEIFYQVTDKSLKNVEIKLKVYTTSYESFDFSVYSFRVHFRRSNYINIHKVTSDQKVICTPTLTEGNVYRCLFIVVYKDTELFNDLMVYPKSQNPSAKIDSFADFITSEIYDSYNIISLNESIPYHNHSRYDTIERKVNFLFLQYGDFNSHALISVISNNNSDIELLTSFKTYEDLISPNPRSAQIYSLDLLRKAIHINFMTRQGLSIDIKSVHGEGKYSFQHDESVSFYLRGEDDKLNYIAKPLDLQDHNTILSVENLRYSNLEFQNPGCAFVLEFFLRSPFVELDSIKIGETKEMVNRDLPYNKDVYYYAKIKEKDKDIIGFFYLHDLEYGETTPETRKIKSGEILFKATIVPETRIKDINEGTDKIPDDHYIPGVYDATLKAGSIQINKNNFTNVDNPVLLVAIRKDEKAQISFKRFRGEIGFNYVNSEDPVTQKLYQFGKIDNPSEPISYKLKTDSKFSNYVRVQFSTNSKNVDFSINSEKGNRDNETFDETIIKRTRGITYVTFRRPDEKEYLYLNIFVKETNDFNKQLANYVFKYMNALNPEEFYEFKIMHNNPRLKVQKENGSVKVTFSPIAFDYQTADDLLTNILYSVKIVPKSTYIPDERTDLIAITESPAIAKQFKHIGTDNRTVEIEDVGEDYQYAQIVAALTRGSFIEYVTYQAVDSSGNVIDPESNPEPGIDPDITDAPPKKTDKPPEPENKNKKALIAIIVVSCFLFVVVVVLIVVIVMYNSKNKDLLTQVNKISFVQSGASAKDDANLLLDNQNELD